MFRNVSPCASLRAPLTASLPVPVAKLTFTPAPDSAYDAVSVPAPPSRVSAPAPPIRVSLPPLPLSLLFPESPL